jgi:hypothetical protein
MFIFQMSLFPVFWYVLQTNKENSKFINLEFFIFLKLESVQYSNLVNNK